MTVFIIVAAVLLWVVVIQRELKKQRARRQADLEAQGERLRATTVGGAPTGPADGDAEP